MSSPIDELIPVTPGLRNLFLPPSHGSAMSLMPAFLDFSFDASAPTNADLRLENPWAYDQRVATRFGVVDGGTNRAPLTVHLDAIQILLIDATFAALAADAKLALVVDRPYLEIVVGGETMKYPLQGAITEPIQQSGTTTTASATTADSGSYNGHVLQLPYPVRLNLETTTTFAIKTEGNSIAADISALALLWCAVGRASENAAYLPGCAPVQAGMPGAPTVLSAERDARVPLGGSTVNAADLVQQATRRARTDNQSPFNATASPR